MGDKNYFAYSPDDGISFWETPGAARAAAEKMIQLYRDDAAEGWPEETEEVCWGAISERARKVDEVTKEQWEREHDAEDESWPWGGWIPPATMP